MDWGCNQQLNFAQFSHLLAILGSTQLVWSYCLIASFVQIKRSHMLLALVRSRPVLLSLTTWHDLFMHDLLWYFLGHPHPSNNTHSPTLPETSADALQKKNGDQQTPKDKLLVHGAWVWWLFILIFLLATIIGVRWYRGIESLNN